MSRSHIVTVLALSALASTLSSCSSDTSPARTTAEPIMEPARVGLPAVLQLPEEGDSDPVKQAATRDFPGWRVFDEVVGDLDGDNTDDAAATLRRGDVDDEEVLVVVYLAGPTGLRLVTRAPRAICAGCGGSRAPPIPGELHISAKGILQITYQGGARSGFTLVCQWRWASAVKQFKMIGETLSTWDGAGEYPDTTIDINYSTMKIDSTVGKRKTKRCSLPARFAPSSLLPAFDYNAHDFPEIAYRCR